MLRKITTPAVAAAIALAGSFWAAEARGADYIRQVPYFHQYSNSINPNGSCQNTCVAMVLAYYGAPVTPDQISDRWGTSRAQTTGGLAFVFNSEAETHGLQVRDEAVDYGTLEQLHQLLDQGRPVIVHGGFSTVGHLMVLLGYDGQYYYAHDPAGRWSERLNGGFPDKSPAIGRYTRYPKEAMEGAIRSADHLKTIRMHALYLEPAPLAAAWLEPPQAQIAVGAPLRLEGVLQLETFAADGGGVEASVDLSGLGGAADWPLQREGEGLYRLSAALEPLAKNGVHTVEIELRQRLGNRVQRAKLTHQLTVLPLEDQVILADGMGPNWQHTLAISAQLEFDQEHTVWAGHTALGLDANGFTLEFAAAEPVDPAGYQALRLAIHTGAANAGRRPTFSVYVNEHSKALVQLMAGLDYNIIPGQSQWQTIEIPLSAFWRLNEPIRSFRFFGNLKGQFYLDEMRLVAAGSPPVATAVAGTGPEPAAVALGQNAPNPFNSQTVISFTLDRSRAVDLSVFNLAGQVVAHLVEGRRPAGVNQLRWDGRDDSGRALASGVYFYRLIWGGGVETRKLVLLR